MEQVDLQRVTGVRRFLPSNHRWFPPLGWRRPDASGPKWPPPGIPNQELLTIQIPMYRFVVKYKFAPFVFVVYATPSQKERVSGANPAPG